MKRQPHNDTHARSARKMARSVVLLLALLAPLVSTTLLAAPPPITNVYQVPAGATAVPVGSFPRGIFTNWTSIPAKQAAILRDPDVAGVGLDLTWPDLEPASGHYQWAALDTPLAVVNGHKQILLRLTSGGAHTPAWVLQQSQTFSFNDPNPYHATAGQAVTIPVFWDPNFLAAKVRMIQDVGAHLAGQQPIAIVAASCANASTNDWNPVSKTPEDYAQWLKLGFIPARLIDACDQIIDATAAAFPASFIALSVASSGKFDASPDAIAMAVVAHAMANHPGRIIVEKNALSAHTPDPTITSDLGSWQIIKDHAPAVAGQMLWFVSGDATCRMNGRQTPCDPATVLTTAITTGVHYGMSYEEIYTADVLNPALASIIHHANELLTQQ